MEKVIAFALIFLTLIGFVGLGVSIANGVKERELLIAQCINDGRKEYECKSMINSGWE